MIITGYNCYPQPKRFEFTESKMASPFTIVLYAADSSSAHNLLANAFALVDSLAAIFTDYDPGSELNRFCAQAGSQRFIPLSEPLFDILQQAKKAYQLSKGSFDISVGRLSRLWRNARKSDNWPAADSVRAALAASGMQYLELNGKNRTARLTKPGIQLDLGGIAQGYIAGATMELLKAAGITTALVDVSGDILTLGSPPGKPGWIVAINTPHHDEEWMHEHLVLISQAVTTSGDLYQFFEHEGKRYSHIINPKTGYGITTSKSVTVVAADAVLADWFTKAVSLLPAKKAKRLARKLHAEFFIAELKDDTVKTSFTRGFTQFVTTFESGNTEH